MVSINLIQEHFKNIFEPSLIQELEACPIIDFGEHQQILSEGQYIKQVPVLLNGLIKVLRYDESGKEILIYEIQPGESCILSITATITHNRSKAIAVTDEPVKAVIVSSDLIIRWMDRYKSWRSFIMNLYYNRLNELISGFEDLAFKHMDERLMDRLKSKRKDTSGRITITHQQLAEELGTAREVISRLLKKMEKEGMVRLSRGQITILS